MMFNWFHGLTQARMMELKHEKIDFAARQHKR